VSRVKARVASGQNATPGTAAGYNPRIPSYPEPGATDRSKVTGSHASPPSVMVMPLALVTVQPATSPWVMVGMEDLAPIWTTDGGPIPATAPGRWGQLRAAGRP
jgi:hypothetical protein